MLQILAKLTKIVCNTKVWTMTELNMFPTWSFVRINATYTNRIPSGGVSYAPFRHFVLLKKYIVYGQGPIACLWCTQMELSQMACSDIPCKCILIHEFAFQKSSIKFNSTTLSILLVHLTKQSHEVDSLNYMYAHHNVQQKLLHKIRASCF